ncbi:imidazole glycerol phosphate synthase subunit HisH [Rhodospirillales bacterium]|nr:imidazole glycerol phosphate synthase subunit HisH [Rhodospirillales bacterium]
MTRVSIVDYDRGNLFSVAQAFKHCGADIDFITTPKEIEDAEYLVLPGVGAFGDAMGGLIKRELPDALRNYAKSGKPFLGICIGMQLLFDASDESPDIKGLSILEGRVSEIPKFGSDQVPHKVPHIGWSCISPSQESDTWLNTPLNSTADNTAFYFVHSFTAVPTNNTDRLADADYNGCLISAGVKRDNIFGFQFHPEKSGKDGLAILHRFMNITGF